MRLNKALDNNAVLNKSNEDLTEENDALKQENAVLISFKDKVINFFKDAVKKIPIIKEFIEDKMPDIKREVFDENDMSVGWSENC